jgi:hypothetical protein
MVALSLARKWSLFIPSEVEGSYRVTLELSQRDTSTSLGMADRLQRREDFVKHKKKSANLERLR